MRTITRRLPSNLAHGDYVCACDDCGANYYRSQLIRKADGLLYCLQTCAKGDDRVTLDMENAAWRPRGPATTGDGGRYVDASGTEFSSTDPEDIAL